MVYMQLPLAANAALGTVVPEAFSCIALAGVYCAFAFVFGQHHLPINLCYLQISSANAEDINRNPILRSLGGIFLVWLTFGFSISYAFYFSVLAAVAGTLSILKGESGFCLLPVRTNLQLFCCWMFLLPLRTSCQYGLHAAIACPMVCFVTCAVVGSRIQGLATDKQTYCTCPVR